MTRTRHRWAIGREATGVRTSRRRKSGRTEGGRARPEAAGNRPAAAQAMALLLLHDTPHTPHTPHTPSAVRDLKQARFSSSCLSDDTPTSWLVTARRCRPLPPPPHVTRAERARARCAAATLTQRRDVRRQESPHVHQHALPARALACVARTCTVDSCCSGSKNSKNAATAASRAQRGLGCRLTG